jgi:dipeptidyl aminopeptidase/acylaminoacyl peptidase
MPDPHIPAPRGNLSRGRLLVFIGLAVVLVASTLSYVLVRRADDAAAAAAAAADEAGRTRLDPADVLSEPHLVVRNTEAGPSYGSIALIPLDDPTGPRAIVDISCERISATAAGAICLQEVAGLVSTYQALFLDPDLQVTGTQELGGIPSRARLSADGSYAASTVFVSGHSYTDAQFSTETVLTDLGTGTSLGNLEEWVTLRDGAEVTDVDRNFWGVSFVGDGPTFYATLGTGGRILLVEGDLTTRTMRVLGPSGACPSVSPDGSHVVYKEQDPESRNFHFVAAETGGGTPIALAEGRLVDDQAAWSGDDVVLYSVARGVASTVDFDIWSAPIDGGQPQLLIPDAASPSVVRPAG